MVMLVFIVGDVLDSHRLLSQFGMATVIISVLITTASFQFKFVYGEGIPNDLTTRVERGPFWGLATTDVKAALSRSLVEDLATYGRRGRVLFYDHFPAGYLFTSMRPASNTTWEYGSTRSGILRYLRDSSHHPVMVFEMKEHYAFSGIRSELDYSLDDPLVVHVKSRCEPVFENSFYRLYLWRD